MRVENVCQQTYFGQSNEIARVYKADVADEVKIFLFRWYCNHFVSFVGKPQMEFL